MLADAQWIARNHAGAAAAFGWNASDLFGINLHRGPGQGGLADRLDGARRLAFTADVAGWAWTDGEDDRDAGAFDALLWRRTLTAKPTLWELAR